MRKIKFIILVSLISITGIALICFHDQIAQGVYEGLKICLGTLIPSLFPFMILSSFIIESGCANILGIKLNKLAKLVFFLPGNCIPTVILSLIGGYPVGARNIKSLYEYGYIDDDTAERMSMFCVGAGPAFIIGVVGSVMFHSYNLGMILFVTQIIASLVIGIVLGLIARKRGISCNSSFSYNRQLNNLSDSFVQATTETSFATINMCAFVTLFSAIIALLQVSGILEFISMFLIHIGVDSSTALALIPSILEITNGCYISNSVNATPLFLAFILSFSSFSVIFQLLSAMKGIKFSKLKFVAFRVIHAILATLFAYIAILIFPQSISTSASFNSVYYSSFSGNILGSLALLAMCIIFVLAILTRKRGGLRIVARKQ